MAAAREKEGLLDYIRGTLHEWRLVLQRVRKPEKDEYIQASKITWLAILVVGSIAYVIHLTAYLLLRG